MDSKLRKTAILTSLVMIALIGSFVFFLNFQKEKNTSNATSENSIGTEDKGLEVTQENKKDGQIGDDLQAFLEDETFFDPETNPYLEELLAQSQQLSLSVFSVEQDLRIIITDYNGKLVSGKNCIVTIEQLGEYKDLDQDGIIYIADLEPGQYKIKLNPVDGYQVPKEFETVIVKEKIEYLPIPDIHFLVKEEADVNDEIEDILFKAASKDGGSTQITRVQETYGDTLVGVDISSNLEVTDWEQVGKSGIDYVIIRAGYRGVKSGCLVKDSKLDEYIKEASSAGLLVGVYFDSQAVTKVEAVEEASMVLELIEKHNITYPVFLNMQGAGGEGRADQLDKDEKTKIAEAFCRTIEEAGYKSGVLASDEQLSKDFNRNELEKYCVWLAEYRKAPKYGGYYQMWQYTEKGSIKGITGKVNLNLSYLGYN